MRLFSVVCHIYEICAYSASSCKGWIFAGQLSLWARIHLWPNLRYIYDQRPVASITELLYIYSCIYEVPIIEFDVSIGVFAMWD